MESESQSRFFCAGLSMKNLKYIEIRPNDCRDLVLNHHYSHRMPTGIKHCYGVIDDGEFCFGQPLIRACVIYSNPVNRFYSPNVIELIRLVRYDDFKAPLSSFVSWSLRQLKRHGYPYVVSYADNDEGHHGGIYQACSFMYVGLRDSGHVGYKTPDGKFIHRRSMFAKYGTSSTEKIKDICPDYEPIYGSHKYLYVKNLKWSKKRTLEDLNCDELPYPKPNGVKDGIQEDTV